jgi:hypothetical protein
MAQSARTPLQQDCSPARWRRTLRLARLGSLRCYVWGRNRRLKASRSRRIAHGSSYRRNWSELSECPMPRLVGRHRLLGLWDQVVLDHPLAPLRPWPQVIIAPASPITISAPATYIGLTRGTARRACDQVPLGVEPSTGLLNRAGGSRICSLVSGSIARGMNTSRRR